MGPRSTLYRLATAEDDYWLDLLRWGDVPRGFPTVVAEREGQIVGYLATDARASFLLAGPLVVDLPEGRGRGVVAMRLLQAYEAVLRAAQGVDHYYCSILAPTWRRVAERLPGTTICRQDADGLFWFRRDLTAVEWTDGQQVA